MRQMKTVHVRFEVFTAVTMKKAVFWDEVQCRYCVNRRFGGTYRLHLQGRRQEEIRERTRVSRCNRLLAPCRVCVNRRFGGMYRLHLQGYHGQSVAPARPGSLVDLFLFSTLKMKVIRSSETSVNTIYTRHYIPEDCFLWKQLSSWKVVPRRTT
jgi:hypothetical protein